MTSSRRRLTALILVMAACSAALWVLDPPQLVGIAGPLLVGVILVAALYGAAEGWPLSTEYRGETMAFTLNGVPLAIGLVFLGPIATLVARLAGTAAVLVHGRMAPLKLLVNLVSMSLEVWVAAEVMRVVGGSVPAVDSPMGWLAIGAAVIAADVVTCVVLLTAIRLSVGQLDAGVVRVIALGNLINFAVGIPLAALTVLALAIDLRTALILAPVAVILALTNRQRHRLATRLGTTQQLYRFITDVTEATSVDEAIERVLERAQLITGATRTGLVLARNGDVRRWYLSAAGLTSEPMDARVAARLRNDSADGLLLGVDHPLLARYRDELPEGAEQVLLAALPQSDLEGVLILADRAGNLALFDDDDVQVVSAIAGHAGTALAEAGLLERLRAEAERREQMALTDAQTGLPNRDGLLADRSSLGAGATLVVEIRDLNDFEAGFGHTVAENIVSTIAARLADVVRRTPSTTLGRLGGGRFAIIRDTRLSQADAAALARQLVEAASGAVEQGDVIIDVGVRVGVAMAPVHGTDLAELLRAADRGLRDAGGHDRSVGWFDVMRDRETIFRLELAGELRGAIEDGHLRLAFQPKVDLASGRVCGLEVLARWPHADRGFIPPTQFIDVAERTGLIRPLTIWVLEQTLTQVRAWHDRGITISTAVNLSNAALMDAEIARDIIELIEAADLPEGSIVLEITESQIMRDVHRGGGTLAVISAAGIPLSVDDFGTGYSSLSHLKTLDVQELKIDRTFITHVAHDTKDRALVGAMVGMARELGLKVVAEGIEDADSLHVLRGMGCQIGQGYHFGRPVPARLVPTMIADIEGWMVDGSVARLSSHRPHRST